MRLRLAVVIGWATEQDSLFLRFFVFYSWVSLGHNSVDSYHSYTLTLSGEELKVLMKCRKQLCSLFKAFGCVVTNLSDLKRRVKHETSHHFVLRICLMSSSLCSAMQGLALADGRSFFTGGTRLATRSVSAAPLSDDGFFVEAAHKKGAGSTKNGRDSISKRRGVKVYGMQKVKAGGIIIRQLGTKVRHSLPLSLLPHTGHLLSFQFHPGENVGLGRDYTIFAKEEGIVLFERGKKSRKLVRSSRSLIVCAHTFCLDLGLP